MRGGKVNDVLAFCLVDFARGIQRSGKLTQCRLVQKRLHSKKALKARATLATVMVFSLVVFIASVVGLYLYSSRTHSQLPEPVRKAIEYPKSIISPEDVDKEISALRKKIQGIKEEWKSGEKKEALLKELEKVKSRVEKLKGQVAPEARKRFDTLVENTEEVITGLREKFEGVGEKLDNLLHTLDQITPLLTSDKEEKQLKSQEEEENERQKESD